MILIDEAHAVSILVRGIETKVARANLSGNSDDRSSLRTRAFNGARLIDGGLNRADFNNAFETAFASCEASDRNGAEGRAAYASGQLIVSRSFDC